MPLKGVRRVRMKMTEEIRNIADRKTYEVLWIVGTVASGLASGMTPVDTGFLINSMYQTVEKSGNGLCLKVGYTARYAEWVKNNPDKRKESWRAYAQKKRDAELKRIDNAGADL